MPESALSSATYNSPVRVVWLNRILTLLAMGGIFVAGMLSVSHLMNIQVPCGTDGGCFTVQNHPSSKWFGMPVAYFGLAGYIFLAALALARANLGITKNRGLIMAGVWATGIGTVVSAVLTIYALTEIKATCSWCLTSAGIMAVSFLLHAFLAQSDPVEGDTDTWIPAAALGVIAFGALGWQTKQLVETSKTTNIKMESLSSMTIEDLVPKDAIAIGPEDAPVTVVEFADLTCGMCKTSYNEMKTVFAKYNGKMRWVFRHFPLLYKAGEHQFALPAALIAEAMREKGKAWPFLDAAFQLDQSKIVSAEPFFQIAEALGADRNSLQSLIQDKNGMPIKRVQQDLAATDQLGIKETPTFFVIPKGGKPIPANVNSFGEAMTRPEVLEKLGGAGPASQ